MRIPDGRDEQMEWLNSVFPVRRNYDELALASIFQPESIGKKVDRIAEDYLKPVRDKIAHAIMDSGQPAVSIDNGPEIDLVNKWLPLAKCIARLSIKNMFPDVFMIPEK